MPNLVNFRFFQKNRPRSFRPGPPLAKKASQSLPSADGKWISIIFCQGVYLAKNTSQAESVRAGDNVPGECAVQPAISSKWEPSEAGPIWKAVKNERF